MKVASFLSAVLLLATSQALASNVAVIDSGVDIKHKDLVHNVWHNPGEIPDNSVDDDNNGFVDDYNGWNFADSNNQVIDYSFLNTFSDDCYKFFDVQGRILNGTATQDDLDWYKKKKDDQTFLTELETFGNFVHGTHVSGIASTSRTTERIMPIKIIPTKQPTIGALLADPQLAKVAKEIKDDQDSENPFGSDALMQIFISIMAQRNADVIVKGVDYANLEKADVANGSFGLSVSSVSPIMKQLLKQLTGKDPTDEEVNKEAAFLVDQVGKACEGSLTKANNTLFVFAAGNDGTDNDKLASTPANIKEDNTISVAASMGISKLAKFSNFGAANVEVAAPGFAVNSTIPGDKYLRLSGTSMAAPYVTEAAALVKDANPKLAPADIKRILMGTVDVKDWLAGKVKTSGIVNTKRAQRAGELSKTASIDDAIAQAKKDVADMTEPKAISPYLNESLFYVMPLPSPLH